MQFAPGWPDYLLLVIFGLLYLTAGWLTTHLFLGRTGKVSLHASAQRNFGGNLSWLEWILLWVLSGLVVTSFVLLLTAQLGIFRIRFWMLFLFLFDLTLLSLLLFRAKFHLLPLFPLRCRHEKHDWLAVPIALLSFVALNRPAEFVATSRDPGEYVNIAVGLADSASLKIRDPDFQHFDSPEKEALFLPTSLKQAPFPEVMPGFYLVNPEKGELLPQFFHLYPLWLALAFKLWRFGGIFVFNVCLGTLGVLLMIPLGERIFGLKMAGFMASILLASNPAQVWLSRSPFSEMLAQVFLLGGLWVFALSLEAEFKNASWLSGLLLGLLLFVRIDSVLILIAVGFFALFRWLAARRENLSPPSGSPLARGDNFESSPLNKRAVSSYVPPWQGGTSGGSALSDIRGLLLSLVLCSLYAAVHAWKFAYPYFLNVIETMRNSTPSWKSLGLTGVLLLLVTLILAKGVSRRLLNGTEDKLKNLSITLLMVLICGLFCYGIFVRPHLDSAREVVPLPPPHVGLIPLYNEINLARLGWYLTLPGLGLAFVGCLILLQSLRRKSPDSLLLFALALATFAGFYLYKSRVFPDNYWVIRRYIEITIPASMLLAALAIESLYIFASKRMSGKLSLSLCCLLFLVVWRGEVKAISRLWPEVELKETMHQMEILAEMNQEADVILMEQGEFQDFFSSPLKFIFHKTVYPLASLKPDVASFERLVLEWERQGKRIFLLSSVGNTELRSQRIRFVPRDHFELNTQMIEASYERLPQSMVPLKYSVQVYEVLPSAPIPPSSVTINMDFNFGNKTTGFHAAERTAESETFRWSLGDSAVELPQIDSPREAFLYLRMAQDLPQHENPKPVKIIFNDVLLGERLLSPKFEVFHYPIPRHQLNLKDRNFVTFSTSTFSPNDFGNSEDKRQLGFMLACVKLQSMRPVTSSNPYRLDLGTGCDEVDSGLTGFFGKEPGFYRWIGERAEIRLPLPLAQDQPLVVSLRAVKSCPDKSFRQFLSVGINGVEIGKTELIGIGTEFKEYRFDVPRKTVTESAPVLQLDVTPAWNPKSAGVSEDWRTLGCAVDWIEVGGKDIRNK